MATSAKSISILPLAAGDPPVRAEEKLFKGSAMTKRGAQAAISYMTCAVLLVMFNKAALSSYGFPCANVITLCQMISSCSFLYALRRLKIISFFANDSVSISDGSKALVPMKTLFDTSPLALTYLLYMLATMESVRGVNVPMYTTLRRTTVVFTMIVEYILVKQNYTIHILGSVALIVLGAFIAGSRDLSFDYYGYLIVFVSNITTAIYLATIARIGKSSGLNSFGLMWCNGILCGPVLLVWTLFRGDLEMTMNFPNLFSPGFLAREVDVLRVSISHRFIKDPLPILKFKLFLGEKPFQFIVLDKLVIIIMMKRFMGGIALSMFGWRIGVQEVNPVLVKRFMGGIALSLFGWRIGVQEAVLLLSCILAFLLNYSIFLNTTLNSALTQTICGNLKDLSTISLGWVVFGGLPFDLLNVIGQLLGFTGSGLYAYYKLIGK